MFLDATRCVLTSPHWLTFYSPSPPSPASGGGLGGGRFDVEAYEHLCRLWTVGLEISVMMAEFPSKAIAELSYEFRTLGLGFADIGGLVMSKGVAFGSQGRRRRCGALVAVMSALRYATSAWVAREVSDFSDH